MMATILWILIDCVMIYFNYKWANEKGGSKLFKHLSTAFFAFWILALGFDLFALAKLIIGG